MIFTNMTLLAILTSPKGLPTNPASLLWFFPLAAAISLVYKAAKLPEMKKSVFFKEFLVLFSSIVVFMALIGVGLIAFSWIFVE
ncbi:MAG: hypothetical protein H8D47_01775 [Planctomycetes bacterium]|nr:hypothetical protein [Planctomycetota bacterium]MBL7106572.1 hypothetical protein [Phycisphaerae bacterium]